MKLTTKGFKATDRVIEVEKLNLIHGKNGTGKTTLTQSLQFLALGYVPALGKREIDTAALMPGSEMEVELTLEDGRTIRRGLVRSETSITKGASASWLRNTKPAETSKEIMHLFGDEELDVAEALDIRQMLNATPNQRAARIQMLLESGKRPPAETAKAVARFTVMRLIPKLTEENMPANFLEAMPLVSERHKAVLRNNAKLLEGKIAEAGITGAMGWANEEKRNAQLGLKRHEGTADQMRIRAVEVPEPDEREIKRLEVLREELHRNFGAAEAQANEYEARTDQRKQLVDGIADLKGMWKNSEQELKDAEQFHGKALEELKAKSKAALTEMEQLKAPAAPDMTPIRAIEKEIEALHAKLNAIELPEIPDTNEAIYAVRKVEDELENARTSPWSEVLQIALKLKKTGDQKTVGTRLEKLAREGLGKDAESLEHDLEAKQKIQKDAVSKAEAVRKDLEDLRAQRSDLENQIAKKAVDRDKQRTKLNEAHVKALAEFDTKKRKLVAERQTAEAKIASQQSLLDAGRKEKEAADRRMASLTDQLKGMGEAGEEPAPVAPIQAKLESTKADLDKLIQARAVHAEIQNAIAAIEEAQAERDVFAAIEWALQRQREVEINEAGGPLMKRMLTFLEAAGRKEKPFVKSTGIGWTDVDGHDVQVQVMSGGEWALFAAALTSTVMLCRNAEVKFLLVEAGETDQTTLQQILAGVAAIADGLTAAFILTPFPPSKMPKHWNVINFAHESVAA